MKIRTIHPACHVPKEVHSKSKIEFSPVDNEPGVYEAEVPDKVGHFLLAVEGRQYWEPVDEADGEDDSSHQDGQEHQSGDDSSHQEAGSSQETGDSSHTGDGGEDDSGMTQQGRRKRGR